MTVQAKSVILDYGDAAHGKLLTNISGAALAGDFLWTVSDEGRTVECLKPHGDGYRLHRQVQLDQLFPDLPDGEADLESVAVDGDQVWICGSHCRVRRKPSDAGLDPHIDARLSRHLFASLKVGPDGGDVQAFWRAPVAKPGGLRHALSSKPLLTPFLELPSKENGLDVEGLAVADGKAFFGLRGPVIDSFAVIAEIDVSEQAVIGETPTLHVLDLGGLAVRDLSRHKSHILIIAGPVNALNGPFRVCRWKPQQTNDVQKVDVVLDFPPGKEHPEGVCPLDRNARPGLLVVYDSPDPDRIDGSRYRADWFAL
jgi:hypothetical protein